MRSASVAATCRRYAAVAWMSASGESAAAAARAPSAISAGVGGVARERLLQREPAHRGAPRSEEGEAGAGHRAVGGERDHRHRAHQREVPVAPRDLREAPARAGRRQREAHRGGQLVGGQRGGERRAVEAVGRDHALAPRPARHHHALQAEEQRGQLGGGIAVDHVAHHGAAVADRGMRDVAQHLREQRRARGGPALERALPDEGADLEHPGGLADAVEAGQAVDVHQQRRARQAKRHHRDEALAARQHLGVAARGGQGGDGLVEAGRRHVVERRRLHAFPSRPSTTDGPSGVRVTRTFQGASASSTALAMAAGGEMAPPSPMPLTPSGLRGDGYSRWTVSIGGQLHRGRHQVVHERPGQELRLLVVDHLLEQPAAHALRHAAVDLAVHDDRVDHLAAVVGDQVAAQRDRAGAGVDVHHRDVHRARVGHGRLVMIDGGLEVERGSPRAWRRSGSRPG